MANRIRVHVHFLPLIGAHSAAVLLNESRTALNLLRALHLLAGSPMPPTRAGILWTHSM
jgi:hypothetical protein